MQSGKYHIKNIFLSFLLFSACANSNAQEKLNKKIKKYEFYNIANGKTIAIHERIYLNDSVFYETNNYTDSSGYVEKVKTDTFKIIHNNWYYKLSGVFKIFFSPDSFRLKIPVIKKAYEFKGKIYGYGPCTSYTPVSRSKKNGRWIYEFYVSAGDCKGGIPLTRMYNRSFFYLDSQIGFIRIKDRFETCEMRVLEYY